MMMTATMTMVTILTIAHRAPAVCEISLGSLFLVIILKTRRRPAVRCRRRPACYLETKGLIDSWITDGGGVCGSDKLCAARHPVFGSRRPAGPVGPRPFAVLSVPVDDENKDWNDGAAPACTFSIPAGRTDGPIPGIISSMLRSGRVHGFRAPGA